MGAGPRTVRGDACGETGLHLTPDSDVASYTHTHTHTVQNRTRVLTHAHRTAHTCPCVQSCSTHTPGRSHAPTPAHTHNIRPNIRTLTRTHAQVSLEPDVVSYNAAISACAKGKQWASALSLLDRMRLEGVTPNVITYNAAISACEKGNQVRQHTSAQARTHALTHSQECTNARRYTLGIVNTRTRAHTCTHTHPCTHQHTRTHTPVGASADAS